MTGVDQLPSPNPNLERDHRHLTDHLRDLFLHGASPATLLEHRRQAVESTVLAAYHSHLQRAFPHGLSLVALGGFGRGELFPFSDVDLLILTTSTDFPPPAKDALSDFLRALWDTGLRLSQTVRTVAECCQLHEGNVEFSVSLLDQRFLTGDQTLYHQLAKQLPRFLHNQRSTLARRLCRLTHQRHARFQHTIYHLEPNIKESPGGWRDLHLLHWLARLNTTHDADFTALAPARELLTTLRFFLHFAAARDANLLTFDPQEEVAASRLTPYDDPASLMRAYFTGAKAIHRQAIRAMDAYESKGNALLAGFRDWRSRLSTSEFTIARDLILFKTPNHAKSDPTSVLRLFELVARHRLALHPETERRLHDALPELTTFFASTSFNWSQLSSLLSLPYPSAALRAMHDTGILKLLLPPWADIESYVVRDFHHRYTVDEHTLIALETLDHLPTNTDPAHQRFRNLYLELEHLPVLRLAILLHDTGKSTATTTHAEASAALAQQLAARLAIPPAASQLLHTLVAQHLALSSAMTTRDLDDPATARHLAQLTGTVEVLKHLTLLTYADTAAVNPTALSPWRLEQLWRLYLTTYRELTLELDLERITETTPEADSPERRAFLKGFPTRYLRIHTDAEINHHLELEQRRRADNVAVEIRKQGALYHLTVLAKDRLFLFASVAGALASFNLNILKAEAFSNQQGTILDTFVFSDPTRSLELNPSELQRLQHVLERILLGRLDAKSLLRHRPQPNPPSKNSRIRPTISFDSTTSSTSTLVEVVAQDRPGLLYDLAAAFSEAGCNIEVVLVTTEAHKAIDVFYVTAAGAKLPPHLQQDLHRRLLAACQP